jgi:predicted transcriptional regulator
LPEIEDSEVKFQTCRLCQKFSVGERGYCRLHNRGYAEIVKKFANWRIAFEEISWERYLETIIRLKETGDITKAVAAEELRMSRNGSYKINR